MQVLMVQHGDFFENLFLVKASLLMRSLVTLMLVMSPDTSGVLFFF